MPSTHSYLTPDFIAAKIKALTPPKSLLQIATEAGFRRFETLEAILTGDIALPMNHVRQLAGVINCSVAELTRLALKDWGLERVIGSIIEDTQAHNPTIAELDLLSRLRLQRGGRDLVIDDEVLAWIAAFPSGE